MTRDDHRHGFISLHRAILDWEWYGDINTCRLFIHLLLTARFQDSKACGRTVRRGQVLTSIPRLAKETGLTPQNVRTALKHLKSTHELTYSSSPQGIAITIKNYEKFQQPTRQLTLNTPTKINTPSNIQHADGIDCGAKDCGCAITKDNTLGNTRLTHDQHTTYNNVNNITPISPKGDVGGFEGYAGEDAARLDALLAFDQMRTKIKKPMTDVARKRLVQKLDKLAAGYPGLDKVDVLEEAVLHCWQSVYPPKNEKTEANDDEKEYY